MGPGTSGQWVGPRRAPYGGGETHEACYSSTQSNTLKIVAFIKKILQSSFLFLKKNTCLRKHTFYENLLTLRSLLLIEP